MEAQRNAVTWPRSLHAIVLVHALEIWFFYAVCLRNSPDVSIKAQWHASLLCPTKAFLALTWLLSQTQAGNPKITERLISRYGDVFTHIWYPHCQSLNCDWRIVAPSTPGFQYTGDAKTPDHVTKTADGAEHAVSISWYRQSKLTAPGIERPATWPARDDRSKDDKYSSDGGVFHVCSQKFDHPFYASVLCPTMPSKVTAYQSFLSSGYLFLTSFSHTHPYPLPPASNAAICSVTKTPGLPERHSSDYFSFSMNQALR